MSEEQGQEQRLEVVRQFQQADRNVDQYDEIHRMLELLNAEIMGLTRHCVYSQDITGREWRHLSGAVLHVDPIRETHVIVNCADTGGLLWPPQRPWREMYTVRAYTVVTLSNPRSSGYEFHPLSLWYAQVNGSLGWYDVSFKDEDPLSNFVALKPEEAISALSKKMYRYVYISPIGESDFISRILDSFARAASLSQ